MTSRERQVLRWGAAVAGMSIMLLRGLPAVVRSEHELRERVASKASQRSRSAADIAALDSLERAAEQVSPRVQAMAPRLLSGATAASAAADISARTRSLVESLGARVDRMEGLGDSAVVGGLRRSGVRVELTTDTPGLFEVLRAIDRNTTVLTISFVRIVASDGTGANEAAENLRVELGVAGLYLPERRSP